MSVILKYKSKMLFSCLAPVFLVISCSKVSHETNGTHDKDFFSFSKMYNKLKNTLNSSSDLYGVWENHWKNRDGYTVNEFIYVDANQAFTCVLNPLNGVEYSEAIVNVKEITTHFIDPEKSIYINQLSQYGRKNVKVDLLLDTATQHLKWKNPNLINIVRSYEYTKIPDQKNPLYSVFQKKCSQFIKLNPKISLNDFKSESLQLGVNDQTKTIMQTGQNPLKTNFCVVNNTDKTILVVPARNTGYGDLAFSSLDILNPEDRFRLFEREDTRTLASSIDAKLLSICQNAAFNETEPSALPEAGNSQTYLVCRYKNSNTGANDGWEWGEKPRWEWETNQRGCDTFHSSNCLKLYGDWAREDGGLGAIGTMFVMNTDSRVEADFTRSCNYTNSLTSQKESRKFTQYYVADSGTSFNHIIWFKQESKAFPYVLPFSRIVAFGDSLSDNGNIHIATHSLFGAGGYFQGRFSNGPVWVEYLHKKLGVDLYNWAVGGSATDVGSLGDVFKTTPYSLYDQIRNFSEAINQIGLTNEDISKMFFTILIGGNNFIRDVLATPENVERGVRDAVENLHSFGAKNILVVNIPDVSLSPKYLGTEQGEYFKELVIKSNELIHNYVEEFNGRNNGTKVYEQNLYEKLNDVTKNPNKYFLTNTSQNCYSGNFTEKFTSENLCAEPETYLFWDAIHPTTTFHCQASEDVAQLIYNKFDVKNGDNLDYAHCVSSEMRRN